MAGVSTAQGYLGKMKAHCDQLYRIKLELPNAIAEKETSIKVINLEITADIETCITECIKLQEYTKFIVEKNSKIVKEIENNPDILEQERRIISNLNGALMQNFSEAVLNFQQLQSEIKNMKQEMTVRNAEILVSRKLNEEEKRNVLENPQVSTF